MPGVETVEPHYMQRLSSDTLKQQSYF